MNMKDDAIEAVYLNGLEKGKELGKQQVLSRMLQYFKDNELEVWITDWGNSKGNFNTPEPLKHVSFATVLVALANEKREGILRKDEKLET